MLPWLLLLLDGEVVRMDLFMKLMLQLRTVWVNSDLYIYIVSTSAKSVCMLPRSFPYKISEPLTFRYHRSACPQTVSLNAV